jgi:hypothetical protein
MSHVFDFVAYVPRTALSLTVLLPHRVMNQTVRLVDFNIAAESCISEELGT